MTVNELKDVLYGIVKEYFTDTEVIWGKAGTVGREPPVAVLTTGRVNRTLFPVMQTENGEPVNYFPSNIMLEVNYFADTAVSENTAVNSLELFLHYINSPYVIEKTGVYNIAVNQEGPVTDLTDLEYDTSWRYRARAELKVCFMQRAAGYKGRGSHDRTGYFVKAEIKERKGKDTGGKRG